jgi:transposase
MEDTIGIDISKDKLDAYRLSKREHKQVCTDKNGVKALALWANKAGVSCVILESTGVHHRCIETGLAHHEISFSRVNPRQARRFCEGAGQRGKNRPGGRCNAGQNGGAVTPEGGCGNA